MGFSISWLAVRGITNSETCARLGIRDSEQPDEANESPISGASIPTGWLVLFLNDLTHPFVTVDSLRRLSKRCEVVGCQVEEHVMVSSSFFYRDGSRLWNVTHESEKGIENLEVDGVPPDALQDIKVKNLDLQAQDTDEGGGVDYVFEVPLELAESVCGYKHDRWQFEWGEPVFTKYVAATAQ
jgi:hypothetical protein